MTNEARAAARTELVHAIVDYAQNVADGRGDWDRIERALDRYAEARVAGCVAEAVGVEREACAQIADGRLEALASIAAVVGRHEDTEHLQREINRAMTVCRRIAAAIRQRAGAARGAGEG